jgi:hypothetical protein
VYEAAQHLREERSVKPINEDMIFIFIVSRRVNVNVKAKIRGIHGNT